MLQNSTRVVQRHFRNPGVLVTGKQSLVAFPEALMTMHPAAVVVEHRFRHERLRFTVIKSGVLHHVLEEHDVVRGTEESRKPKVNFALASGSYFVMVHLRLD